MRQFLNQQGLPLLELHLSDFATNPKPTGRDGHACNQTNAELPQYPIQNPDGTEGHIRLAPITID
jgi:hypothetical protein